MLPGSHPQSVAVVRMCWSEEDTHAIPSELDSIWMLPKDNNPERSEKISRCLSKEIKKVKREKEKGQRAKSKEKTISIEQLWVHWIIVLVNGHKRL